MFVCSTGDPDLIIIGARHAVFVDQADDNARTELISKAEHLQKSWLAVLIIGRVQNALTACVFEAGFHFLPFGRVEHQRNLDRRRQPRRQRVHIRNAVASDEIDVDIEDVCTFFFLRFGEIDQPVPILSIEQITHLLRAGSIDAFADDQERSVLRIRLLEID